MAAAAKYLLMYLCVRKKLAVQSHGRLNGQQSARILNVLGISLPNDFREFERLQVNSCGCE
jgi:hypothetical protein